MQAALADVWNLKYGLDEGVLCNCHKYESTQTLLWVLTSMSKNHKVGHKYAQDGGGMCRGWSEWCFILELCQPKRDWSTDSFGGTAGVVVSEVGKNQPSSCKEWSQPFLPVPMQIYWQCYCLCLWSHTVNGPWDVIWANNKPLLLLPSQIKKKS